MTMVAEDESPLSFPCTFPIKAMGRMEDDLEALVMALVRRHVPEEHIDRVHTRASGQGSYLAVTVTIHATSRAQLDAIYLDLTADHRVRYAL